MSENAGEATWTRTLCPACGPDVAIDEDGCCASCGATATGEGAEEVLRALDEARGRVEALEEVLLAERLLLQRKLGDVEHHETRAGINNVWVNAFAAAHLPDWEIRQRLEAIDAALSRSSAPSAEPEP